MIVKVLNLTYAMFKLNPTKLLCTRGQLVICESVIFVSADLDWPGSTATMLSALTVTDLIMEDKIARRPTTRRVSPHS